MEKISEEQQFSGLHDPNGVTMLTTSKKQVVSENSSVQSKKSTKPLTNKKTATWRKTFPTTSSTTKSTSKPSTQTSTTESTTKSTTKQSTTISFKLSANISISSFTPSSPQPSTISLPESSSTSSSSTSTTQSAVSSHESSTNSTQESTTSLFKLQNNAQQSNKSEPIKSEQAVLPIKPVRSPELQKNLMNELEQLTNKLQRLKNIKSLKILAKEANFIPDIIKLDRLPSVMFQNNSDYKKRLDEMLDQFQSQLQNEDIEYLDNKIAIVEKNISEHVRIIATFDKAVNETYTRLMNKASKKQRESYDESFRKLKRKIAAFKANATVSTNAIQSSTIKIVTVTKNSLTTKNSTKLHGRKRSSHSATKEVVNSSKSPKKRTSTAKNKSYTNRTKHKTNKTKVF
jgi:hypothetical protein